MERQRHGIAVAAAIAERDTAAPVNALMFVATAAIASAVFAAAASAEGLPVLIGVLLPWLVLAAAAVWWIRDAAARVRRRESERAELMESARRVAVRLLLADTEQPKARLESAAALLLDSDLTDDGATRFLERSEHLSGGQLSTIVLDCPQERVRLSATSRRASLPSGRLGKPNRARRPRAAG